MSENITTLSVAQPLAKERQLAMLDLLREEVERGEIVCLFVMTIRIGQEFHVSTAGDISMATLAGMLGRAQLDALEMVR